MFEDGTDVIVQEEMETNSDIVLKDVQDVEADFIIAFREENRTELRKNYKIGGSYMRLSIEVLQIQANF